MSLSIANAAPLATNTETAVGLKTANLVKNQQEKNGEMAMNLIASAVIESLPLASSGALGTQVDIKV